MRQAYDYWQNQPGNYRAPGLANGAPERARRDIKSPVSRPLGPRRGQASQRRLRTPTLGFHLTPLNSPGHLSPRGSPAWTGGAGLGRPERRARPAASALCASAAGVVSRCSGKGWPAARNPQNPSGDAGCEHAAPLASPVTRPPGRSFQWGADALRTACRTLSQRGGTRERPGRYGTLGGQR